MRVREVVPEDFQSNRRIGHPILPQHIDHFPVASDAAVGPLAAEPIQRFGHRELEASGVGCAGDHEPR